MVETVIDGSINRDGAGALGGFAEGRESADAGIIHVGACGSLCW